MDIFSWLGDMDIGKLEDPFAVQVETSTDIEEMLSSSSCSSPVEKENRTSWSLSYLDGSTCSSPFQDDDGDAFGLNDIDEVFFQNKSEFVDENPKGLMNYSNDIIADLGFEIRNQHQGDFRDTFASKYKDNYFINMDNAKQNEEQSMQLRKQLEQLQQQQQQQIRFARDTEIKREMSDSLSDDSPDSDMGQMEGFDDSLLRPADDIAIESINSLKKLLLEETGDHLNSAKGRIKFIQKSNHYFTQPQINTFPSNYKDSNNNICFINMENSEQNQEQLLQLRKQIEQQLQRQQVRPSLDTEVKREGNDRLSDDRTDSDMGQMEVSPTQKQVKRKKRKYERRASARKNIQLFQFMLKLLDNKDECVTWVSREEGVFKLLKSKNVAEMWGKYKKNENMTYESLSRALRHYYSQEILIPVPKKLHYKFCKKTLDDWYKSK